MSLINKMLQDLESHRAGKVNKQEVVMPKLDATKPGVRSRHFSRSRAIWFLSVLCLVILISVFSFLRAHAQKQTLQKTNARETAVLSKQGMPNQAIKDNLKFSKLSEGPAVLQSIKVVPNSNQTLIQMTLSHKVHYQLQTSDNHQKLELILANTSLSGALPEVSSDNAIKSVDTSVINKMLHITIQLNPGSEVQSLSYNGAKTIVLSLAITSPEVSAPKGELSKSAVPLSPSEIAMRDYQKALQLANNDQVDAATGLLEQALIIKPDLVQPREALVILLLQQRNFDMANKYIAEGLQQMPNYIPYIELQARALLLRGSYKQALYVLQKQSPSLKEYPNYYALMAALQERMGNASQAVQLYSQLVALQNNNGKWWFGLGYALESDNRPNAAVEAYRHAISVGGLSPATQVFVTGRIQQLGG